MIQAIVLLLLLATVNGNSNSNNNNNSNNDENCRIRFLSKPIPLTNFNISTTATVAFQILRKQKTNGTTTTTTIALEILRETEFVIGVILLLPNEKILALNTSRGIKLFSNYTKDSEGFWKSFDKTTIKDNDDVADVDGWLPAFKDCKLFRDKWIHGYLQRVNNVTIVWFYRLEMNQCDDRLMEIFKTKHQCDDETTYCVPGVESGEKRATYRCMCRNGFYHPQANFTWGGIPGEDIEDGFIDSPLCLPCPTECDVCEKNGICMAKRDFYLKTVILSIHLGCMVITVVLAFVVFKQRKTKSIASSMWTVLETILLGIFILYSTVVIRFFEPSIIQCLFEPWAREVGFIICYGAIILKLYRHLIEFRTRKAHRWVVKDTDLLKYLWIMIMSVLAYMAAYTSITLNFMQENYSLLYNGITQDGLHYQDCKPLWWDYVTEIGELVILIFGIHLSYASRNARTQFHERNFLCAAISIELAISTLFYIARILLLPKLHPDLILIIYCLRTQLSTSLTLVLVFVPKFWYQQKQVRSLAQEFSCRIPVDAFKDVNAHGPLTGNNSDVDVGEITLADMSPDDIRAELKRLYLQLEIFKSKTICRDNPHISKRRGGRKAQHRRFSLQNLHGKHRSQKQQQQQEEITEAEPSRTPEDSVCSNEGPSAIYSDLPSTTCINDHK